MVIEWDVGGLDNRDRPEYISLRMTNFGYSMVSGEIVLQFDVFDT